MASQNTSSSFPFLGSANPISWFVVRQVVLRAYTTIAHLDRSGRSPCQLLFQKKSTKKIA